MRYLFLPLFLCACFEADQHVGRQSDISSCQQEAKRIAPFKPSETGNDINAAQRQSLLTSCLQDKGYNIGDDPEAES